MRERQQSLLPPGLSAPTKPKNPEGPEPARHRTGRFYDRVYGRAYRSIKEAGARIKETTLRLLPGFPGAPPTVQRANRAAAADQDGYGGFPGFTGGNGGWARTEYGEYYATSVLGAQSAGTK